MRMTGVIKNYCEDCMKLTLFTALLCLSFTSVFAGEMKKIDYATRETVANEYYNGIDDDGYYDYMMSEVMNLSLEAGIEGKCLVTVSGIATNYYDPEKNMYKFLVCINKKENGDYLGKFLKDELLEI